MVTSRKMHNPGKRPKPLIETCFVIQVNSKYEKWILKGMFRGMKPSMPYAARQECTQAAAAVAATTCLGRFKIIIRIVLSPKNLLPNDSQRPQHEWCQYRCCYRNNNYGSTSDQRCWPTLCRRQSLIGHDSCVFSRLSSSWCRCSSSWCLGWSEEEASEGVTTKMTSLPAGRFFKKGVHNWYSLVVVYKTVQNLEASRVLPFTSKTTSTNISTSNLLLH